MERRLATILAADAVGYSQFMARDEGGAYQALSRCRTIIDQAIEQYHGRIFGSAGDSVVAEFMSSVNAVQCAIDIQRRLAEDQSEYEPATRMMFRIGVNLGDVIVEGGNLLGDGVNIAARLEALSPANGICVADNVREQISGKVKDNLGYAGRHRLKNIEKPIDVWCWPNTAAPQLKRVAIKRSRYLVPLLMVAAFGLAGLSYAVYNSALQPPGQVGKARIAVLPFSNANKNAGQDYFVDGITSDLITDLSKISALFVIAPNSVFAFKGRTEKPQSVAKELGVDPHYARALAGVAFSYTAASIFFASNDTEEATLHALTYGKRSLELDASLPQGHFAVAVAYLRRGQHQEALAAARQAVRYDPNYSDGYAVLASILGYSGQGEKAESHIRRAMSLNPRYSAAYIDILGRALFVKGDYDSAISSFEKCIRRDPAFLTCRVFLAGIFGLRGRKEDAEWQAQEILNLDPNFKLSTDAIAQQFEGPKYRDQLHTGLRVAGISG